MKTVILWGLVLLNVLLLTAFVGRISGSDAAMAQNRRPSEYLLIPATTVDDAASGVVYMLDATNGVLGGMVYDDARRELNTMAPLNIDRIFSAGQGVVPGGGGAANNSRTQRRGQGGRDTRDDRDERGND